MNKNTISCPECRGTMEVGFLPEVNHNGTTGTTCWHPGVPTPVSFLGFKIGMIKVNKKQLINVRTYRCTKCGLLKSYAPTTSEF